MFAFFPGPSDLLILLLTSALFIGGFVVIVKVLVDRNRGPKNCPKCGAQLRD